MYSLYRQGPGRDTDFSLFTTMRFTTTTDNAEVVEEMIPLWPYHLRRLKEAHAHFSSKDEEKWRIWPGKEVIWGKVREKLKTVDKGDYRVCPHHLSSSPIGHEGYS
jgi:hypothetical protein